MIKKIIISFFLLLFINIVFVQQIDHPDDPPYLKVPYVPPFTLILSNKDKFKKDDLPKKHNIIMIYLNTDCGHCKTLVKHIVDSVQMAPNSFFVLSCYNKLKDIKEFEETNNLKSYEQIVIGRDEKYFIPTFYRVKITPFVAVYNKKGDLIKAFSEGFSIAELQKILE